MKSRILAGTTALALLSGAPFALAQAPAGPAAAAGHYTGPSSVPLFTVKSLLETSLYDQFKSLLESGHVDQHARLQGHIVSHDGGKSYSFADDSGRMVVKISARRFPAGQSVSAQQRVELVGELDKDFRKTTFKVKELRLLP